MAGLAAAVAGLDERALERFLQPQRWFDAKGRGIRRVRVRDLVPLDAEDRLGVARVEAVFDDGGASTYQLPLAALGSEADVPARAVVGAGPGGVLVDAVIVPAFRRLLGRAVGEGACFAGGPTGGDVRWRVRTLAPPQAAVDDGRPMGVEQSNTSLVYGDAMVVKLVRKLERGVNPDVEIGEFLARHTSFRHVPALLATLVFEEPGSDDTVAGMAQRFVPSVGDGWTWALERLRGWLAAPAHAPDDFWAAAAALGRITRGLHQALASRADVEGFAPEPVTAELAHRWAEAVAGSVARTIDRLGDARRALSAGLGETASALACRRHEAVAAAGRLATMLETAGGMRIRHHGDYHLGQVLRTRDDDFVVLDFEGEPARPLAERRAKHSPLRDVAGMLRSFDYAAGAGAASAPARGREWAQRAREAFLDGYLEAADEAGAPILPAGRQAALRAVALFELEKVFYELAYELGNRPDWVAIPLDGALRVLDGLEALA